MTDALIAFFGMALFDVFYALFSLSLNAGKRLKACVYSGITTLLVGFVVIEYTENHALIWAAAAGSLLGTWLGMLIDGKKE